MKFRVPEIILGALLAVAVFAMGALFASSKHSDAPQQNHAAQTTEAKGSQGHEAKSLWIPDDATGFFTLWIAAFTGVLAVSTIFLWRSTRDAAIAARTAAEHIPRVERAYIFIGPGEIGVRRKDEGRLVETTFAFIQLNQYGPTPGFVEKVSWGFTTKLPQEPDYSNAQTWDVGVVMKGKKTFNLPAPGESEILDPHYLYAKVDYNDIFRAKHISRFCIRIHPRIGKWETIDGLSESWNDWD
jgi:hypothetical protein